MVKQSQRTTEDVGELIDGLPVMAGPEAQALDAALQKLDGLRIDRAEAERRLRLIEEEYARLPRGRERITLKARRMLEDSAIATAETDELQADITAIREQVEVLAEAERLQTQAVDRARAALSAKVCQDLVGTRREIIKQIASGLAQVDAAMRRYTAVRDELDRREISLRVPLSDYAGFMSAEKWEHYYQLWQREVLTTITS